MKRRCKRCGKIFIPVKWNHLFCGSKTKQTGCSWLNSTKDRAKRRWQTQGYKEYQRKYGKEWHREQRGLDTRYAKRQRQAKRKYYQGEKGKEESRQWRKRNIDKILFWNKKRALRKKNIIGVHTWQEWEELKKKYGHRCVVCGVSELELQRRWSGSNFIKLTEDHIVPIVKGGTDYINNIQPLCISCNAKKKDK